MSTDRDQLIGRRIARRRRRWQVGRAYDMAREIARYLRGARHLLDVGCGNGFIAHHLKALLAPAAVRGCDVGPATEAPIAYTHFDGRELPFDRGAFDSALLCYVLHHAGDPRVLIGELRRVLVPAGRVVVYEDLPETWFDRLLCIRHDRAWHGRGGAGSFKTMAGWRRLFADGGFRVLHARRLSRLRDVGHPVRRALYVLERGNNTQRVTATGSGST